MATFGSRGGDPPSYFPYATVIVSYGVDMWPGGPKEPICVGIARIVCLAVLAAKGGTLGASYTPKATVIVSYEVDL